MGEPTLVNINELHQNKVAEDSILWVKTITDPSMTDCVCLVVEDKNKLVVPLQLYNQLPKEASFEKLCICFPKYMKIGIQNPYLRVTQGGFVVLRNDNPRNIKFESLQIGEMLVPDT